MNGEEAKRQREKDEKRRAKGNDKNKRFLNTNTDLLYIFYGEGGDSKQAVKRPRDSVCEEKLNGLAMRLIRISLDVDVRT